MHLDSQKRVYVPGVTYFITTVTKNRYPYFIEGVFLDLFIHDLYICQDIRNFELHGFAVIPDHVHLLISPGNGHSHSEIMHNLKRVTSLHINQIMHGNLIYGTVPPVKGARPTAESADIYPRLRVQRAPCIHGETRSAPFPEMISRLHAYRAEFAAEHPGSSPHPLFRWHKSFHDHIIRDERDCRNHLRYVARQEEKHVVSGHVWIDGA